MKIPGKGFMSGYRTQTLAYTGIAAMWIAYAIDAPVFGNAPLGLGEVLVATVVGLIAIFQRAGTKKAQAAAEASKTAVTINNSAAPIILAAFLLVPMAGCAGKIARDEILSPALRLAADGVRDDVLRGVNDAVEDGDLTRVEGDAINSRAAGLWFAIAQEDRAMIGELFPVWTEIRPFAVRGIQDRVDDIEIGAGGAGSRLERVDLFEEALIVVAQRL